MFFPDSIKIIKPQDKVLKIGPGWTPHPKATVFLEKKFYEKEAESQRGYAPALRTNKEIVYFDGGRFPFVDNEFNYVICSHILEHVTDIESFTKEIQRVPQKGYIEFLTIYYDHIYNFPENVTLLYHNNNTIFYLPKNESYTNSIAPVTRFFYRTLQLRHDRFTKDMKNYFFEGFEWSKSFQIQKAKSLDELTFDIKKIKIAPTWRNKITRMINNEFV